VEAGEGRVGSLGDRLRLLCYGFDAARGIYTETITLWLQLAAIVTVASTAAAVAAMNARSRRGALQGPVARSAGNAIDAREPEAS
jgi:protein SCO1/2